MPSCCAPVRPASEGLPGRCRAEFRTEDASVEGMIRLPGGTFLMGTDDGQGFRRTARDRCAGHADTVLIDPPYAMTNAEFAAFVEATGYVTEAERIGWSFVFHRFCSPRRRGVMGAADARPGGGVEGADWRRPRARRLGHRRPATNHPVVHVSGTTRRRTAPGRASGCRRRPSGSSPRAAAWSRERYPWGDDADPGGRAPLQHLAGARSPTRNTPQTATRARRPVGRLPAQRLRPLQRVGQRVGVVPGLVLGRHHVGRTRRGPHGPARGTTRVIRGGSYLCHDSYCNRYRVAARSSNTPDSSTGNMGFRCAADA